ncbi:MAG: kelch repeat-containing protein [Rhodothermales bacterium]
MSKSPAILVLWLLSITTVTAQSDMGTWFTRTPLPTARQEMPHVLLNDKIYVLGGIDASRNSIEFVEAYDPQTGTWEDIASLPPTLHHLGAAVANGKLYVLGGYISGFTPTDRVFEFDPGTQEWTEKNPMPAAQGAHAAVSIDNKIYIVGGERGREALNTNQMYDPITDTWTARAPLPTAREHLAATVLDGKIYVIGGRRLSDGALDNLGTVEIYDPATDSWDRSAASLPRTSGGLAAAALHGRVYAFGGEFFGAQSGVLNMTAEYNPEQNTWRELAPMPVPRHGMGAVAVADTIFIIGGGPAAGFATSSLNSGFVPPKPAPTTIEDEQVLTEPFSLSYGFPNPTHSTTTFHLTLSQPEQVKFTIYDALGRETETLINRYLNLGTHQFEWDAGGQVSGLYFGRIVVGDVMITRTLVKR